MIISRSIHVAANGIISFFFCGWVVFHYIYTVAVVQSLSHVQLFVTPWTAAHQGSLSLTISQRLPKFMSVELVMLSNNLNLCCLLLLPSVIPRIRVFSSELALCIRWPKYPSFSFSISPSNEYSGFISFRIGWFDMSTSFYSSLCWWTFRLLSSLGYCE